MYVYITIVFCNLIVNGYPLWVAVLFNAVAPFTIYYSRQDEDEYSPLPLDTLV